MSPLGKDETGRASPVVATLPFDLYITGSIPHGDTSSESDGNGDGDGEGDGEGDNFNYTT